MRLSPNWKDETSYGRGDKERVPRTWALDLGFFKVYVTRHRHYAESAWVLSMDSRMRELKSPNVDTARLEAQQIVEERLTKALELLRNAA